MKKIKIVVLAFGVRPIIVERSKKTLNSMYPWGKRISFTLFAKIHWGLKGFKFIRGIRKKKHTQFYIWMVFCLVIFWEGEGGFKYIYIKGEHVPIELVMKLN
jgi:hypothetical protein